MIVSVANQKGSVGLEPLEKKEQKGKTDICNYMRFFLCAG